MARLTLAELTAGAVLWYWYNTGAMGYTVAYVQVVALTPRRVRVRYENGTVRLRRLDQFDGKATPAEVASMTWTDAGLAWNAGAA